MITKYTLYLLTLLACPLLVHGADQKAVSMASSPKNSEFVQMVKQFQSTAKQIQSTAKQIDSYINSLSPSEQAEFQRVEQEIEQRMSNMSQKEIEQFLENTAKLH